jgi:O-antigen ligase
VPRVSAVAQDRLLLATMLVLSWDKLRWEAPAFSMTFSNILATAFVAAFAWDRIRRRDTALPVASLTLLALFLTLLAVFLLGYWNLLSAAAMSLWLKGLGTWAVHFLLIVCGVAHLARRGAPLYGRCVRWFVVGIALNAVYGVVQLLAQAGAGVNVDATVIAPLTGAQGGGINVYGRIGEGNVYRINALTGDPNHLGVILCVPLLVLLPLVFSAPRRRAGLAVLLACLLVVQALTLSRSAALGDIVGLATLAPVLLPALRPYAGRISAGIAAVLALLVLLFATVPFARQVLEQRAQIGGAGTQTHLDFYRLVPPALDPNPLVGMGFNTFAVFYEDVTGRPDYGPHSIWVAILVETGLVGLAVYLVYVIYIVMSAAAMRASPDRDAALLGWGLLAALLGTAAANFFYLTMNFDYFFALALLAVAGPIVFGVRAGAGMRASTAAGAPAR